MPLFDPFIRPEGSKPPLSEAFILFNRISSTLVLNTLLMVSFHWYFFRQYKLVGFMVYMMLLFGTSLLDMLVSNSFGRNIEKIRRAGYSDLTVFLIMEFNRIGSQLIGYTIVNYIITDDYAYTFDCLKENLTFLTALKILTTLALTEVLFLLGHGLMHTHEYLMKYHVMHHCCVDSTWNTNLLFHPVDLAIEFGGPAVVLLGMHFFCWQQDQPLLLYTYLIFQLWYAYDHDETMRLYHTKHHKLCDSLYVIYTDFRLNDPGKNLLIKYMQERGLLSSTSKERSSQKEA